MIDLERRLIEYGDELDRRVDPVSLSELADLLDHHAVVAPVRWKRPSWRVAVVAAALMLVVVGGLALLTTGGADSDQVGSDDKTLPSGPVELAPGEWVVVPGGEVFERSHVDGLTFGREGLVAVGVEKLGVDQQAEPSLTLAGVLNGDPGEQAAVWTSADGTDWLRVPHDPEVFGVNGRLADVTATESGYVIVGGADGIPALWTSEDTVTWTRVQAPSEAAALVRLLTNNEVIVAQGSVAGRDLNERSIWVSADGKSWVHVPEVAWSNPPIMAAGPSFVILGEAREWIDQDQTQTCEPVVWTSPDGMEWESHRPTGDLFAGEGCAALPGMAMTWLNDSLIAVAAGSAWTSSDGVAWVMHPASHGAFGGVVTLEGETPPVAEVNGLASRTNSLVAVGRVTSEDGEVGSIWTSTDGTSWSGVPHDPALFGPAGDSSGLREVVTTADGFVAMGSLTKEAPWCEMFGRSTCGHVTTWIWVEPGS